MIKGSGLKGRGSASNPPGRYERYVRVADPADPDPGEALPTPATTVTDIACRTAMSRNTSPDIPFDRSINPYQGCEHGCVYCYARPSHAYHGLSSGLDFETRLFAKPDLPERLKETLARPGYAAATVMLGANTDAYQPIERRQRITRRVLEILAECRHPVAIATKSALVLRDVDVLRDLARDGLVSVGVSLTTLDAGLARRLEPRASSPARRLAAMAGLSAAGVHVAVLAAPLIPFVNDHELERLLAAAAGHGASSASYVLVRLPHDIKQLMADWLARHMPDRAERVLGRIRDIHGGALYDPSWQTRMRGGGTYAHLIEQRFALTCRRLGLNTRALAMDALRRDLFRAPQRAGVQLRLL